MNEKEKNLPEETPETGTPAAEQDSVDEALDEIEEKVTTDAEAEQKADAAEDAAVVSALDSRLAQKRRRKFGVIATLITVGVVAAAVVLNILIGELMDRYPLSIDLTSDSLYEISDETIDYIQNLDQDITIHVLATKENLSYSYDYMDLVQAGKTLDAFAQNSDKITVDYIDLAANPTFAANYPD
ncbi:MAG TPA: Gldg family protein, partial [Oscillospiraceae bacterium]|nr:Gldg family protein [Oscillospiraceae bacterium]